MKDFLKQYLQKSGTGRVSSVENLITNEHGFFTYFVDRENDYLFICDACGDGEYWDKKAQEIASMCNVSRILAVTVRNPKAFERRFGYKNAGTIMVKELNKEQNT